MGNRRAAIIPTILALGVAGAILAAPAVSVAAIHTPTAQVQQGGTSDTSGIYFHL